MQSGQLLTVLIGALLIMAGAVMILTITGMLPGLFFVGVGIFLLLRGIA